MAKALKTLLLLSQQSASARDLDALMAATAPRLTRKIISAREELEKLDNDTLAGARIISFLSGVVVPHATLLLIGHGAYNIHPGSPSYPGWAPPCFAAYDRAEMFGATAHEMTEAIDTGPIVDVELVRMPPTASVMDYYRQGTAAAARLLWRLAPRFATNDLLQRSGEAWAGTIRRRRDLVDLCQLDSVIDAIEMTRRIAAFGAGLGGERPRLNRFGHAFVLESGNNTH